MIYAIIALILACLNVFIMKYLHDDNVRLRKINDESSVLLNDMKNMMTTLNDKLMYMTNMAEAWKEQAGKTKA